MMDNLLWFIAEYGSVIKMLLRAALCIIFFLMHYFYAANVIKDRYELAKEKLWGGLSCYMKETKWNVFNYYYLQKFLDSVGATYYSKETITPLTFISYKILSMIAGFLFGILFHPLIGILISVIAFFIPDSRMKERDKKDNETMMRDVMNVYDVVTLQTNSGVYVSQILVDAYMIVKNKRLKSALLELTGKIKETNDIGISLEVFSGKFRNEHIENLSVAIGQAVETGNSAKMLEDIKKHMVSLQKSYNRQEQLKVKRRGNIFKIAVFVAVAIVLVYGCAVGLMDSATGLGL